MMPIIFFILQTSVRLFIGEISLLLEVFTLSSFLVPYSADTETRVEVAEQIITEQLFLIVRAKCQCSPVLFRTKQKINPDQPSFGENQCCFS